MPSRRRRTSTSLRSCDAPPFNFEPPRSQSVPVLALQARSSYWTSARGNPPGHWSPPGAHQKDRGTGGGRLLPASRLGPSGLPTPGLDRTENGTGGLGGGGALGRPKAGKAPRVSGDNNVRQSSIAAPF